MPAQDEIIEFTKTQPFIFERFLDKGATGLTALLKDPELDIQFVCKKYEVDDPLRNREYYERFIDEVRLLYNAFHPNVVRIFASYLFRSVRSGFILMEYVDGTDLLSYLNGNPHRANSLFEQTLSGFAHLEKRNILHRDIRPSNVMVTNDGVVKIIDFGFGKRIDSLGGFGKSITLNWAASEPKEFENGDYTFCTECYFVGKLFDKAVKEASASFDHSAVVRKMIEYDPDDRVKSFAEARNMLRTKKSVGPVLDPATREAYLPIAEFLTKAMASFVPPVKYAESPGEVLEALKKIEQSSLFETSVQNNSAVINAFVKSKIYFYPEPSLSTADLEKFVRMFEAQSSELKKAVLSNLWSRFASIPRKPDPEDDIPF